MYCFVSLIEYLHVLELEKIKAFNNHLIKRSLLVDFIRYFKGFMPLEFMNPMGFTTIMLVKIDSSYIKHALG